MKILNIRVTGVFFLAVLLLAGCGGGAAPDDEQKGTIVIGQPPYSYADVPIYIINELLQRDGYEVELLPGQSPILAQALSDQSIDIFTDIWMPNLGAGYIEPVLDKIEMLEPIYADAPLGIVVPSYMEEVNSIPDLIDHADEFDGTIYGIEEGTGMNATTEETIEAYDLPYELVPSSEGAMIGELQRGIRQEDAVAILGWRPHTMFQLFDVKLLEDPKGVWKLDSVYIAVREGFTEEYPEVTSMLNNMTLSLEEIEAWMLDVEENNRDQEEMAAEWVDEHADRVAEWQQ